MSDKSCLKVIMDPLEIIPDQSSPVILVQVLFSEDWIPDPKFTETACFSTTGVFEVFEIGVGTSISIGGTIGVDGATS